MGTLDAQILSQAITSCKVSIQLVSPASGDPETLAANDVLVLDVSIQLVSPASGDECAVGDGAISNPFPFN